MSDETKLDRALQHLNKYALGSRVVKEEVSDRRVHLCWATHHCIIERSKRRSIQFALDRHVKVVCLFKLWRLGRIVVHDARGAMLSSRESRVCDNQLWER